MGEGRGLTPQLWNICANRVPAPQRMCDGHPPRIQRNPYAHYARRARWRHAIGMLVPDSLHAVEPVHGKDVVFTMHGAGFCIAATGTLP
jgi:hypothetical protein